jgi:hypothetical protein
MGSTGGGAEGAAREVLAMLENFASVGTERFDVTITDLAGSKVAFRSNRTLAELRPALAGILDQAAEQHHNVIVRPRCPSAGLIQLDDLDDKAAARLWPVSFLTLRTSPGNYQAWVAVADASADADLARRLRKGAGADASASGATRVAGSLNFKEKYAPIFPRVETVHANPGLVVRRGELQALGVVAPPERRAPAASRRARRTGAKAWPSYQTCVDNAPVARDGARKDISRADFAWSIIALDWGWQLETVADRLMQESPGERPSLRHTDSEERCGGIGAAGRAEALTGHLGGAGRPWRMGAQSGQPLGAGQELAHAQNHWTRVRHSCYVV